MAERLTPDEEDSALALESIRNRWGGIWQSEIAKRDSGKAGRLDMMGVSPDAVNLIDSDLASSRPDKIIGAAIREINSQINDIKADFKPGKSPEELSIASERTINLELARGRLTKGNLGPLAEPKLFDATINRINIELEQKNNTP
jgi:hypothetical protein